MFLAHIPAGYLVTRKMADGYPNQKALFATGLFASILPDADLFWFYLVSDRQVPHHAYFFHWPLFWVAVSALVWIFTQISEKRNLKPFIWVFLTCTLLHMALDSVAAEITWLQPFSDVELNLVHVDARYEWWVWNFVFHWTFCVELAIICVGAATLWHNHVHDHRVHKLIEPKE